jgi:hypothetical protein
MFEEQEFKKIILLMKTCMVVSVIAALVAICAHWRGFSFSISPVATETKVVVVERSAAAPAPVHHRKPRPIVVPEEDETASSYQPIYRPLPRVHNATARIETVGPDAFAQTNIQSGNAPSAAAYGEVPDFTVTVHPKRRRWPRRFFGKLGAPFRFLGRHLR